MIGFLAGRLAHLSGDRLIPGGQRLALVKGLGSHFAGVVDPHQPRGELPVRSRQCRGCPGRCRGRFRDGARSVRRRGQNLDCLIYFSKQAVGNAELALSHEAYYIGPAGAIHRNGN